ncbi:MAG: 1-acyl-sn-glycerol-3-phosphate acyltransferase [Bacteroidetes bacterium]|nr:1-acyl-sn-glycerol-3-phosphate acyltransferase [Bacteroidota bacterium]
MINLIYLLVKYWVRFTLHLYCKRITWHDTSILQHRHPLLIGAHHPNSFFDAIIVGAYMRLPVHFMTRSDVFKWSWVRYLLRQLQMIPVYRIRDGKDKLGLNDTSFKEGCTHLKNGEHVLIFVEGFCDHQTTLQPLKKGAARMLLQSWEEGTSVEMLPLWMRYNSFKDFPKTIDLMPGIPFGKKEMEEGLNPALTMQWINQETAQQLATLSQIPSPPEKNKFNRMLLPLAMVGFLLHFPFFYFFKYLVNYINRGSIHYDSLMYSLMALAYPFWLLLIWFTAAFFLPAGAAITLPLWAIIGARAYVLWK